MKHALGLPFIPAAQGLPGHMTRPAPRAQRCGGTNRAMTWCPSLGTSADGRRRTNVPHYHRRTWNARAAALSLSRRDASLERG